MALLLGDLARLDLADGGIGLSVVVVDNASNQPVQLSDEPGLDVRLLRLEENTGGSGGFSRGMEAVLREGTAGDSRELLWLLDSDARVEAGALGPLVQALDRHPELAGVGSALVDPTTGAVFEAGGEVDPRTGEYLQALPAGWDKRDVVPAGYIAACSLLVRRSPVERSGVMADLFISGDDVEWCYRISERTGLGFAAVTASRVRHPSPDKMRTWGRYYASRNAFQAMTAAGVRGRLPRLRRALREVGRAVCQVMVGRDDLAKLHLAGLRDARLGLRGAAPAGSISFEAFRPLAELDTAIKDLLKRVRGRVLLRPGSLSDPSVLLRSLNAVCVSPDVAPAAPVRGWMATASRAVSGLVGSPGYGIAVVSARGKPEDWLAGRVVVTVAEGGGFTIRRINRIERARRLIATLTKGSSEALRLMRPPADEAAGAAPAAIESSASPTPTLSIVILSYNRWDALQRTLNALAEDPATRGSEVIVVDNASVDGTPDKLRTNYPGAKVVVLRRNIGVAGFNEGVRASTGDAVLILDDDAHPGAGVLDQALALLARRPDIAAVSLHPRTLSTRESEWTFAGRASERWPIMGCGNLIRRTAWDRAGGYEESFFLYRNDVDLAMKLLSAGYKVQFNPEWVVWHESDGTKSLRWFEGATRNWIWLCRRHGLGADRVKAMAAGWLWAHRLAGWSPGAHGGVMRGAFAGLLQRAAPLPPSCRKGRGMREYLAARNLGGSPRS